MNLEEIRRNFKAEPDSQQLAQQYLNIVDRTIGYDNLTNFDRALYIGANITLGKISSWTVKRCSDLGNEACSMIFREKGPIDVFSVLSNFNKKFCVEFAVWCGRKILYIFDKKYPGSSKPRLAIELAENWLADPSEKNRLAAWDTSNGFIDYSAYSSIAATAGSSTTYETYIAYARDASDATAKLLKTTKELLLIEYLMSGIIGEKDDSRRF